MLRPRYIICIIKGSWLQVYKRFINSRSFILGVDIVPIKPIKKVYFIRSNIIKLNNCYIFKKFTNSILFDLISNDGSPNIGGFLKIDCLNQVYLFSSRIFW